MNLHFITSISKEYWYETAQYCISTWDLPGKVTIYIDQKEGDVEWFNELPFEKRLLHVPVLEDLNDDLNANNKVYKFWGKASAQLHAVYNKQDNERIIWLDADMEQIGKISKDMFTMSFKEPLGMLYSNHHPDCWETGLVIFNQEYKKLKVVMNKYRDAWNSDTLSSFWKPYDAQVLGYVAEDRGYYNLCTAPCKNLDAVKNSIYGTVFKHWINKENKAQLKNEKR